MPRTLYNEGRVVGYSAYEIYVRQLQAVDPDAVPASEKEWLASMLATGTSMLLRVGSDSVSGAHYKDIQLPSTSRLCAANTILASIFIGDGSIGSAADTDDVWATKVTDYGSLLSNTPTSSPSGATTHSSVIPAKSDIDIDSTTKDQLKSYMRIIDGIIIQPGTWVTNSSTPPSKDFQPTLSDYPMLRLSFSDTVDTPFYILLTGFTDRGIIYGVTDLTGSLDTDDKVDGDFLGPAVFPWSAKVIFSVPPVAIKLMFGTSYEYARQIESESSATTVDSTPIIDFTSANPTASAPGDPDSSKYGERYNDSRVPINVSALDISRSDAAVVCTFTKKVSGSDHPYFPPALYGTVLTGTGITDIYPIDVVSPDTLHLFQTCDDYEGTVAAKDFESVYGGAKAFVRDPSTYIIQEYDDDADTFIPVAATRKTSIFGVMVSEPKSYPLFYVQGDLRNGLTQRWNGADYDITGHMGGEAVSENDVIAAFSTPELWYLEVDDSISSEYTLETIQLSHSESGATTAQGLSGTTVIADKLIACHVDVLMYRRLTGKFSDKIKEDCGFQNIYDENGNPTGQFGSDGIWGDDVYAKYMFGQIPAAERKNYYAIFPESVESAWSYPVRSSDNFVDGTQKYIYHIIVNGSRWNIPHFANSVSTGFNRSSEYLGSWFNATTNPGGLTANTYDNKWALINISGVDHPTAYSLVSNQGSGQVYQEDAMLPCNTVYPLTMNELFGTALNNSGIKEEFKSLTVLKFLQIAMYTDMGTGKPLSASTSNGRINLHLPTDVFSNGYNSSTGTYSRSDMVKRFSLDLYNSAANSGKSQIVFIPDEFLDDDIVDPMGAVLETGRQQAFVLCMTDKSNVPYSVYGTAGTEYSGDPGTLTWYQMLKALAENKTVNVIGDNNYIELNSGSSPIRLYVSSTAPTGTIPNGSIGIGWGTGVHKYTSGAWS